MNYVVQPLLKIKIIVNVDGMQHKRKCKSIMKSIKMIVNADCKQ